MEPTRSVQGSTPAALDLDRVVTITGIPDAGGERSVSLPGDLRTVEAAVAEHEVALVVVDPLLAFLDPRVDALRDQDVRQVMHALAAVVGPARSTNVVIRRLTEAAGTKAIYCRRGR